MRCIAQKITYNRIEPIVEAAPRSGKAVFAALAMTIAEKRDKVEGRQRQMRQWEEDTRETGYFLSRVKKAKSSILVNQMAEPRKLGVPGGVKLSSRSTGTVPVYLQSCVRTLCSLRLEPFAWTN